MNSEILWLDWTGLHITPWKLIGYTGALMFGGRWLVQFIASRRKGRPVIPRAFWYMSIVGSFMTLSYFLFSAKQDSVGVLQNLFPAFTAFYSLWLDIQHRGWDKTRAAQIRSQSAQADQQDQTAEDEAVAQDALRQRHANH